MANPQAEPKEEIKALEQKTEENYKACDLDIAVMKKASEEAMKKMAINDARRLEMGEIARKRVEAIYQYPQMIGQYRRLYEEVAV